MAVVAFDNSAKQTVGMTATAVMSCVLTATSGAILLAGCLTKTDVSISACYAGATPLTQLGRIVNNGAGHAATLYIMTAPPSGVLSLSATLVGGASGNLFMGAVTYTGVRTTGAGPIGDGSATTAGAVATFVASISTSTTDCPIVFAIGHNNFSFTSTVANTRVQDGQDVVFRWVDAVGPAGNAVSISASCVNTNQNLAYFSFNLIASASAVSGLRGSLMLLGVGT